MYLGPSVTKMSWTDLEKGSHNRIVASMLDFRPDEIMGSQDYFSTGAELVTNKVDLESYLTQRKVGTWKIIG